MGPEKRVVGRTDRRTFLDGGFSLAHNHFQASAGCRADSAVIKADLASAYFERAEAADRATDYRMSTELLAQALKARPDNPMMLFNYAIVLERMTKSFLHVRPRLSSTRSI